MKNVPQLQNQPSSTREYLFLHMHTCSHFTWVVRVQLHQGSVSCSIKDPVATADILADWTSDLWPSDYKKAFATSKPNQLTKMFRLGYLSAHRLTPQTFFTHSYLTASLVFNRKGMSNPELLISIGKHKIRAKALMSNLKKTGGGVNAYNESFH